MSIHLTHLLTAIHLIYHYLFSCKEPVLALLSMNIYIGCSEAFAQAPREPRQLGLPITMGVSVNFLYIQ